MDELIYGVWKGRAYANRRTIDGKAPEGLPLSEFLAFNSGNPVAGFVVFLMMARPYLLRTMGLTDIDVKPMAVRADFDWLKPGDRQEFVRVRRNDEGGLDLYHTQNSQVLSSCAWADGLVDIPVGSTVRKGDMVSYYPFCQFFA